jgi:hypothetical protein
MIYSRFYLMRALCVTTNLILAVMVCAQDGAQVPISGIEGFSLRALGPSLSVPERIRLIEQFVHRRYFDEAGLMYSHINWQEERPFTAADFSSTDSTMPGPEPHQWMSYENSAFISGLFLAAQCYRYEVTRDPEALEFAQQAYRSIDANYQLTEQRDSGSEGLTQKAGFIDPSAQRKAAQYGFFCKPYYGLGTDRTSTEQHFGPLVGLYRYWPLATPEIQDRIAQIFSEVSRRWRAGYKINFFGEAWDLEKSYPRAQRHMFLWAVMHRMAYELTHEAACYDEFARLDALYGAMPTPKETSWGLGQASYISTEDRSFHVQIVMGAEILLDLEPSNRARYLRGMGEWWKYSFIGQREDLLSYYFVRVDSMTGAWDKLPLSIKPRAFWRSSFLLHNATLPICWLGTRERQGISSAIVANYLPEEVVSARDRLRRVYGELNKEHLKWFADPEGVMPGEIDWMLNVLQGDSLAFYSLGYWYARANNITLP